MNLSALRKNAVLGFLGQLFIIILGIIVPRMMISGYGSDANGVLSTVTQILTYMALLEAGISQAAKNALFKPLAEKDRSGISTVLSVSQSYFRRVTLWYALGVLLLSVVIPFILNTNMDKGTIFLLVLLEGGAGVISFYFVETQTMMFAIDGRSYINTIFGVSQKAVVYAFKILMAYFHVNILVIQVFSFLILFIKIFVYKRLFAKYYAWVELRKTNRKEILPDRNSYVITEVAGTIFTSTDLIVISVFLSTGMSSVYSVYGMVFSNLSILLGAVYFSVVYILGQAYHEDINKYEVFHDGFMSVFLGMMSVLMAVAYILCIPFVAFYTKGITDVNYINYELPFWFAWIHILTWSRFVGGNLTGIAGYAKQTSRISVIEAGVNVISSIIFVKCFGVVGALLGTALALPVKIIWCIYISDKKVLKRSYLKTISILAVNYMLFMGAVLVEKKININIDSVSDFLVYAVVIGIIFLVIGVGLNILVNRSCLEVLRVFGKLGNKKKKKVEAPIILYKEKENCCGCSACFAICPNRAIFMKADEEGFLYPEIDTSKCIQCQKCISVCTFKSSQKETGYLE